MNYYERHLGDYAKDTAHLSMLEHGAYGLMLDRYYATEQGIPDGQAHRVARARTKDEKQAVDSVLAEFFTLTNGVWINLRAEEEIIKAQGKIKAAQENGKKGGRPKSVNSGSYLETQTKPSGLSLGSVLETQTKAHQTPDTRHQAPEEKQKQRAPRFDAQAHLVDLGVDPVIATDWVKHRKSVRAEPTVTAIDGIAREADKAGMSLEAALRECCLRGWRGFKADWLQQGQQGGRVINSTVEQRNKAVAAAWVPPELRGAA